MESDARSTGVQLKSVAKPSTVIGLIAKHADCRITFIIARMSIEKKGRGSGVVSAGLGKTGKWWSHRV